MAKQEKIMVIRPWKVEGVIVRGSGRGTIYIKLERMTFHLLDIADGEQPECQHEIHGRNGEEAVIRIRKRSRNE